MLTLAILFFLLAGIIVGFNAAGIIAGGALAFSLGFMILAAIAGLSFWRGHPA